MAHRGGSLLRPGAGRGQGRNAPAARRSRRAVSVKAASTSMKDISGQVKNVRSQMEADEDLAVLMRGLRGQNIDESDFATEGLQMKLVQVDEDADESLPLQYDPDAIAAYWSIRPVSVMKRAFQLLGLSGGFLSKLLGDYLTGKLKQNEVARAIDIRNIVTSLGPAYIKLGQALSIRPDILSPAAMNELQKLCDKVPSFDNGVAMELLKSELGKPWQEVYAELSPAPIAAASLGQVYKGKLMTGEAVAVKVQRPYVLETVTIDLFILRAIGVKANEIMGPNIRTDVVALLDEWAERFFEELDYVREGENATLFAEEMKDDLPQVKVPKTYSDYTSRRVLTTEWLEGEKLSQSTADDVGTLVNVGVICYLKQLLETGNFHADPHPGNLIRTPDGRLAILDFGLMTQVDNDIKFGMIEAVAHLIRRDYEAIVEDFVTLDFIPPGTDLRPILPVLAKVFDQALEGGGAKNINFQDLAADLAQITFDYPFRIPPYFALIIRAIGVLEGIALVGNPEFALVDEAYPYISKRLLTDPSPRLQEALRFMVYDRDGRFDMDRMIDLLEALEGYNLSSRSARGDLDTMTPPSTSGETRDGQPASPDSPPTSSSVPSFPLPFPLPPLGVPPSPLPLPGLLGRPGGLLPAGLGAADGSEGSLAALLGRSASIEADMEVTTSRDALRFMLSGEGAMFREFLLDEAVKAIDALNRDQVRQLVASLGLQDAMAPVLLPGVDRRFISMSPKLSEEDEVVLQNVQKFLAFLLGRNTANGTMDSRKALQLTRELMPLLPDVAREILPELNQRLISRTGARIVRDLYA